MSTASGAGTSLIANSEMFVKGRLAIDLSGGVIAGLGAPVTNITGTTLVNITAPIGVINLIAPLINILGGALGAPAGIVNTNALLINETAIGAIAMEAPKIGEISGAHTVVTGIYKAFAGVIMLN